MARSNSRLDPKGSFLYPQTASAHFRKKSRGDSPSAGQRASQIAPRAPLSLHLGSVHTALILCGTGVQTTMSTMVCPSRTTTSPQMPGEPRMTLRAIRAIVETDSDGSSRYESQNTWLRSFAAIFTMAWCYHLQKRGKEEEGWNRAWFQKWAGSQPLYAPAWPPKRPPQPPPGGGLVPAPTNGLASLDGPRPTAGCTRCVA